MLDVSRDGYGARRSWEGGDDPTQVRAVVLPDGIDREEASDKIPRESLHSLWL
jgi:hypothetical protein